MDNKKIARVVCLLHQDEFGNSIPHDLIKIYKSHYGERHVLHSPINDFSLAKQIQVIDIIKFLKKGDIQNLRTVIHCSAGMGRTGHILACWLVVGRKMSPEMALKEVKATEQEFDVSRSPGESGENLDKLLRGLTR